MEVRGVGPLLDIRQVVGCQVSHQEGDYREEELPNSGWPCRMTPKAGPPRGARKSVVTLPDGVSVAVGDFAGER